MTDPQLDALFAPLEENHGGNTEMVLERTPPHNFEAEAALLGAILNNNAPNISPTPAMDVSLKPAAN